MRRAVVSAVVAAAAVLMSARAGSAQQVPKGQSAEPAPPGVAFLKLTWGAKQKDPPPVTLSTQTSRSTAEELYTSGPPLPSNTRKSTTRPGDGPRAYVYAAKVRNRGREAIKAAVFEFVFSDPATGEELARHRFYNFERIGKGETTWLRSTVFSPPTKTVSAEALGKEGGPTYRERAEFLCVVFADGTTWKHAAAPDSECQELRARLRSKAKTTAAW